MSEMKNRDNCHELPELVDNLHKRLNSNWVARTKSFTTVRKNLELAELQSLMATCCIIRII